MDTGGEKSFGRQLLAAVRRHFTGGVLVTVPVVVTLYVLYFLFQKVDGLLSPLLHRILGYSVPGMGLLATLLLIVLAGILIHQSPFGSRLYALGEILFIRTPLVRAIYSAIKQLVEAFTFPKKKMFDQVVFIEYPRKGILTMAFASSSVVVAVNGTRSEYLTVFVPSTPTPVTGWMVLVPREEVIPIDLTIEEAAKILMSGGIATPQELRQKATEKIMTPAKEFAR
jgi:uncharacterized membrane protein